jgi:enediyne biosynthesis protein E4
MRLVAALSVALSTSVESAYAQAIPSFVEETGASGIDSVFEGEWEYMVGGGVAVFDCSGDGFPDMFLAGGSAPAKLYRNASNVGGELRFEAVESGAELDAVAGAYPLDIDGDGITDLVLLRVGENVVLRGFGECRFERANEDWGFDGGDAWSTAFAATWEKGADFPTLAIGNYVDRSEQMFPWGSCTDNWLHRPHSGERRFVAPLPLTPSYCTLSMLFTDWNRSGTPSLRVSNDREYYKGGQEQLWHVAPGEAPTLYTAEEGWQRLRIWGMGIASYDLGFDGYPDYFLTSMADNKLQRLMRPETGELLPRYDDIAFAKGVTAHRPYVGGEIQPSTAWHAQFEDVNNDGLADLFIAKGNVWEMPDFARKDPNNLLVQKPDGTFFEAGDTAGVASMFTGRGAALADFNLDGLVDLVVVNRHDRAQIWRNASPDGGRWVQVKLEQDGPNRDAIGAWIEVRRGDVTMRREATSGGGHVSGQSGWWHFGLGDLDVAEIRVIWPDGMEGDWARVAADGFYVVARDAEPVAWRPSGR